MGPDDRSAAGSGKLVGQLLEHAPRLKRPLRLLQFNPPAALGAE